MKLSVKNYKTVSSAEIEINPIALVAGGNGQGKTSLCEAAQATATSQPIPIVRPGAGNDVWSPAITKKDGGMLVKRSEGGKTGSARLANEEGYTEVSWPLCETKSEGKAPLSAVVSSGMRDRYGLWQFFAFSDHDRAEYLAGLLETSPGEEQFKKALEGTKEETVEKLWKAIGNQGWDGVWNAMKDHGIKLKGNWRDITGEQYGAAKGEKWMPAVTEEGNAPDLDAMEKTLMEANEGLAEAQQARRNLPPAQVDKTIPCPHCQKPLVIHGKGLTKGEALSKDETAKRAAALVAAENINKKLQIAVDVAGQAYHGAIKETKSKADAQEKARQIHLTIGRNQKIIDTLSPGGLRKVALQEVLDGFNDELSGFCDIAKWGKVALTGNLEPELNGQPMILLSDSERYKIRVILQMGFATHDKSDLLVMDGADILEDAGRNSLMKLVMTVGNPALIAMTMNKIEDVPNIPEKWGKSYWIENGEVKEIEE